MSHRTNQSKLANPTLLPLVLFAAAAIFGCQPSGGGSKNQWQGVDGGPCTYDELPATCEWYADDERDDMLYSSTGDDLEDSEWVGTVDQECARDLGYEVGDTFDCTYSIITNGTCAPDYATTTEPIGDCLR